MTDLGTTVLNTASVVGTPPTGDPVTDDDSADVPVPAAPGIMLDKEAGPVTDVTGNGVDAGDTVTYSFTVYNTGNVPLDPVVVTDPMFVDMYPDGALQCGTGVLGVGQSRTCDPVIWTLRADQLGTTIENTATVVATPPSGDPVSDDDKVETPIPVACVAALPATTTSTSTTSTTVVVSPTTVDPAGIPADTVADTVPNTAAELVPVDSVPVDTAPVTLPAATAVVDPVTTPATAPVTAPPDAPPVTPAGFRSAPAAPIAANATPSTVLDVCASPTTTTSTTTTTLPPATNPPAPTATVLAASGERPRKTPGGSGQLPATGNRTEDLARAAAMLLAVGFAAVMAARSRRQQHGRA